MQAMPDLSQLSHAQKDELILALWQQVQSLSAALADMQAQVKQLQGQLAQNSRNSSRPPSSDGLAKPAPKSLRVSGQRPTGGQPGHTGATLSQSAQVDHIVQHRSAPTCSACHSPMVDHQVIEQRQVLDIPSLRVHVTEHQLIRSRCPCGAVHEGVWPIGINVAVQYGAQVKALAVHLNQHHLLPLARTSDLLHDLFGLQLCEASVQSFAQQAAQALQPTVCAIGQAVSQAGVVHADESGIRVQTKLHWLHCAVTQSLTWLGWHAKRGRVAFEALGILGQVRGTLVHDGLAGYKELACQHSLCNAHHLRELVYVGEHEHEKAWHNWPQQMIDLLCQANTEVRQHGGPLCEVRQAWYASQWDTLLALGELYNPQQTQSDTYRTGRGRRKQSKAFNLLKRLRLHRHDVWRFMTDKDVPFTNNLAEQALRMCKVKQKISGGFRTSHGADTFFTIRSYLATMHKQGHGLFDCLVSTFNGQPIQPRFA